MASNSQFAVATHILTLLALVDRPLSSKVIAESINTNPVVVRRLVGTLHAAGFVATAMGADGGTRLEQAPEDITLLDVFSATGQGELISTHPTEPNPDCIAGANILPVLLPVFDRAEAALRGELDRVTIAQVAAEIRTRAQNR